VEKSDQKEVEYMMLNNEPWIDTRLNEEEMDFLWEIVSEENKEDWGRDLAGNISKSELIKDKDNWFFEMALKKLTERMFYRDLDNYHKYHIEKEEPLPEFELKLLWVNYQKQHEFNPLHMHNGGNGYSFVIFVKIPTHWKEQHALPFSANSTVPSASNFQFVWSEKDSEGCRIKNFLLSPEEEGRMLFFPAWLKHQVYPFYGTEEKRVTISGNISLKVLKKPTEEQEMQKIPVSEYEQKENMLKMLEESVRVTKEELKRMKIAENV
jgi:hypothetical protein